MVGVSPQQLGTVSFTPHPWAGGGGVPGLRGENWLGGGFPALCGITSALLQSGNQMSPSQRNFIFHKAEMQNIDDHF